MDQKEKPPDVSPPIKTRGNYLDSQKRMKANTLSLGAECTILRSRPYQWKEHEASIQTTPLEEQSNPKETNDGKIFSHHRSQAQDHFEVYLDQLRLKHKESIGKYSNFLKKAGEVKQYLFSKQPILLCDYIEALTSLTNLAPVLPSENMFLLHDYEDELLEDKLIRLPPIHDASQNHIWRSGDYLGHPRTVQHEIWITSLSMFSNELKKDLSSFSSSQAYQWRPGELSLCKKTTRKKVLVTSNALIQEEPPDQTPLLTVIMSTEQTHDHIQVSNTSCLIIHFVSQDSTTVRMSLLNPEIIEKNIGIFKEHLESNYYLRIKVNEKHDKDNALIKAETCLLVFSDSMTVITHFFFAKSAECIAGTKEEPPDLEVLSFSFFVRTGIGVNLIQEKKHLAYFRMVFEVGEKVSAKKKIHPTPKTDGPVMINKKIIGDYTYLRGKYKENSLFKVAYSLPPFIADQMDLRTNPFQVGEDDVILPSNMEKELVAELEHGAKDELEPEEALKMPIGLLLQDIHTHKDHLSHEYVFEPHWSHYMLKKDSKWGMVHKHSFSLISGFVPLGFPGEVFNEAYDPYIFIISHYAIQDLSRPIYLHHFVAQDMRRKENDLKSHFEFKLSFNYFSVFRV